MDKTTIEIPTELLSAARLTAEEAKAELAIRLYRTNRLTFEQAKKLGGISGTQLVQQLWEKDNQFNLNDFLSWASHDLKTPLNAIIGFSKVVLKGIDGPINEMQLTDLTSVNANGQRMLVHLTNLVDIARLNNAEVKLNLSEIEFSAFVAETAKRWTTQNPGKELVLDANLLLSPVILGESPRLRQALMSWTTYVSLFIDKGGVHFLAQDDATGINITIQSNGEKARDKSVMEGAMLSFIGKSLIELHGGRVEMSQEMDDGAMVILSLPRQN
jgi:signal transduction histidine kinase